MNKREKVIALFKPDSDGVSDWVTTEAVIEADLSWTKNGNIRRGVVFGMEDFKWEARRKGGPRSEVIALRMAGMNTEERFRQTISLPVKRHFENEVVCNLSMMAIAPEDREIDHRYGHKDHPDYVALYRVEVQSPSDFQLIHRSLNQLKRQMCKVCVETGRRPAHPEKDFVEGTSAHPERFPCSGCYVAQPERYR